MAWRAFNIAHLRHVTTQRPPQILLRSLKSIDETALRLRTVMETMKPLPVGEVRTKAAGEVAEAVQWLTGQLPELKVRFAPYLKFRTWT